MVIGSDKYLDYSNDLEFSRHIFVIEGVHEN